MRVFFLIENYYLKFSLSQKVDLFTKGKCSRRRFWMFVFVKIQIHHMDRNTEDLNKLLANQPSNM